MPPCSFFVSPDAAADADCQTALHPDTGEVPVVVVNRLEFAAVNDDQCLGKEVQALAQDNELTTYSTKRFMTTSRRCDGVIITSHTFLQSRLNQD
jgi:hypothetical protein